MIATILTGLLVAFGAAPPLAAQGPAPEPGSAARAFYAGRDDVYAAERAAMRDARGRVARTGGRLRLQLAGGRVATLADTLAEGASQHRFVYQRFDATRGLHVVGVSYYEGGAYLVYHDRTGQRRLVPGPPVVSPDGRRFLSASLDLEAGYDPNRLELWRVGAGGLRREFAADGGDAWGPDSAAWAGPDTVRFARTVLDPRTGETRGTPARLVRRGGRWVAGEARR